MDTTSASSMSAAFKEFTQDTFLKLFVTQLKNQNPMEPMSNDQFTVQLAQMGQLEQLTTLNSNFAKVLRLQEFDYAKNLVGSEVTYTLPGGDGAKSGTVTGARLDNGEVKLVVGSDLVPLASVTEIKTASPAPGK